MTTLNANASAIKTWSENRLLNIIYSDREIMEYVFDVLDCKHTSAENEIKDAAKRLEIAISTKLYKEHAFKHTIYSCFLGTAVDMVFAIVDMETIAATALKEAKKLRKEL